MGNNTLKLLSARGEVGAAEAQIEIYFQQIESCGNHMAVYEEIIITLDGDASVTIKSRWI